MSGLASSIFLLVSSILNKFVSFLFEAITLLIFFDFVKILTQEDPTSPFDPNINTFFFSLNGIIKYI